MSSLQQPTAPALPPEPAPTTRTPAPSFVALVLLSAISPLATDMYLPGLPALGHDLGAGAASVQLTLTAFLIGLAVGQLVIGPVSDAVGRRVFLVGGPVLFIASSVVCALAPTVQLLIAARLVQGSSAPPVWSAPGR